MAIWRMDQIKAPPQTDDPAQLRQYIKYLSNQIASMLKDLDYVLNGQVDFRNVRAKSIKADNLNVDELSAITANMGKITSGEIYGAYIATREAAFPRAEINDDGDLLAVYTDAENYLTIEPGISDEPTITFRKSGTPVLIIGPAFGFSGVVSLSNIVVGTQSGSLQLECGTGVLDNVTVPSWGKFINSSSGLSLQDELDAIWTALAGKADA